MMILLRALKSLNKPPKTNNQFDTKYPDPSDSWAPHKVFNIGNSRPTPLIKYVEAIEKCLKKLH